MKKLTEKKSTDNFITDILQQYSESQPDRNKELVKTLHEWSIRIILEHYPDWEKVLRESVGLETLIEGGIVFNGLTSEDYEALLKNKSVKSAFHVLATTTLILNQPQEESLLNISDFRLLFDLGLHTGVIERFESESKPIQQEFYEKHYSGAAGKKAISKRWEKRRALLEKALLVAKIKYQEGVRLLHNEMADLILKESEFKKLSKPALMKEIKPIARKYGLVRGEKGTKK